MSSNIEKPSTKRELNGALAATLGLIALACTDDDDDDGKMGSQGGTGGTAGKGGSGSAGKTSSSAGAPVAGAPGGAGGEPGVAPDADVLPLNALLSAEYSAITAYTAGAGLIGDAPSSDPLFELAAVITAIAVDIQAQHKLHAEALVDAIEALGGTPVIEADVAATFVPPQALLDNPSITNVLKFAAGAERGAAIAYNQVLAGLEDAKHRFIASSIEGDETQHFIVLAALVLGLADPGPSLDEASAGDVIPQAFVSTVGAAPGLDDAPADYFP